MSEININIQDAKKWINEFSEKKTWMGPTVKKIVDDVDKSVLESKFSQAWDLIYQVLQVCDEYNVKIECAEVRVHCACSIFQLGDLERTVKLLQESSALYHSYRHQQGIVHWMLGCVYWQMPGEEENAIASMRRSIQLFEEIPKQGRFLSHTTLSWYEGKVNEMRQDLETALDDPGKRTAFIDETKGVRKTKEQQYPAEINEPKEETVSEAKILADSGREVQIPKPSLQKSKDKLKEGYIRGFPYLGQVPAGGFSTKGFVDFVDGESDIDCLNIEGVKHRLFSLTDSKWISIAGKTRHFILAVTGNSMNKAGIMDGDYVLVREQNNADSYDIVVTEIFGIDDQATLKRFVRKNGTIILRPESTDSRYEEFSFSHINKDFSIRGIAIAVLKREGADLDAERFQ